MARSESERGAFDVAEAVMRSAAAGKRGVVEGAAVDGQSAHVPAEHWQWEGAVITLSCHAPPSEGSAARPLPPPTTTTTKSLPVKKQSELLLSGSQSLAERRGVRLPLLAGGGGPLTLPTNGEDGDILANAEDTRADLITVAQRDILFTSASR
jgi:hypothetical protein